MTEQDIINIFEIDEPYDYTYKGDRVFDGLKILSKYMPDKTLLCAADHDIIYSVSLNDIIGAGVTEDDVRQLRRLNWMLWDEEYLAHYV